MEDLSLYTEDEIYEMLKDGTITIDDLDAYIKDGTIDSKSLEIYLKDGLIGIQDLAPYIKTGTINTNDIASYINSGVIAVDDVADYIKDGVIDASRLSFEVKDTNDTQKIETIQEEAETISSPKIEEAEVKEVEQQTTQTEPAEPIVEAPASQPEEQPAVEVPEPAPQIVEEVSTVETPEMVPANQSAEENNYTNSSSYDEAKTSMDETYKYCLLAGLMITDMSLRGKAGRGPYISFEINSYSRQILNHLMTEFYLNNDGISLEFMRDMDDKKETFTIGIDEGNLTPEELYARARDAFQRIYQTVETTRNDMDYEATMPHGLKEIKERFKNDDPEIGQDFIIGYINKDGKDTYYVVADNNIQAMEYARSIGYDIKETIGTNIHEIDGSGPKIEAGAENLAAVDEATNIAVNGVTNLDIYGPNVQDPKVEMITNFIATSNDPHLMCILDVEVPANNPNQRIVTMKTEGQEAVSVVFPNAQEFDQKVMPKIIDTYVENNDIYPENVSKTAPDALSKASCQVESSNNTILSVRGYPEEQINQIVENVKSKKKEENMAMENTNAKQKTIGTYQPNKNQHQAPAFVSMPVLFVICILFILMISLIIFAG